MRRYRKTVLLLVLGLLVGCLAARSAAQVSRPRKRPNDQWVTPPVQAQRLQQCFFESAAVKAKVSYFIYIPEIYDTQKNRRFPVLYWLHGGGGGVKGVPKLVHYFDSAIRAGRIPPMLVVFPNGLSLSLWVDSKDGRVPMETIVMKELLPRIDANYRTIASRDGRLVEGFSMGGYGAAHLAFKYPEIFGAVSILSGGPLDPEFKETPRTGPRGRERVLQSVFGGDLEYYKAQSPWMLAKKSADALRGKIRIRLVIGERDEMLELTRKFNAHLTRLKIPHEFIIVPRVGHNPMGLIKAIAEDSWKFYRAVFGKPSLSS